MSSVEVPFSELTDWVHRKPGDECYACGAEPPKGIQHTIDHVVPIWLASASSTARPTAALCLRCKTKLDPIERAFKNEIAFRTGSTSRLWQRFKADVLFNKHPLSMKERTEELLKARPFIVDNVPRAGRFEPATLYRGVSKLARGLFRANFGRRLQATRIHVALLDNVDHFLRVHAPPLRTFRVGDDFDVVVEGADETVGRPLFRLRFARCVAIVTAAGSDLVPQRNRTSRFRVGAIHVPDRA